MSTAPLLERCTSSLIVPSVTVDPSAPRLYWATTTSEERTYSQCTFVSTDPICGPLNRSIYLVQDGCERPFSIKVNTHPYPSSGYGIVVGITSYPFSDGQGQNSFDRGLLEHAATTYKFDFRGLLWLGSGWRREPSYRYDVGDVVTLVAESQGNNWYLTLRINGFMVGGGFICNFQPSTYFASIYNASVRLLSKEESEGLDPHNSIFDSFLRPFSDISVSFHTIGSNTLSYGEWSLNAPGFGFQSPNTLLLQHPVGISSTFGYSNAQQSQGVSDSSSFPVVTSPVSGPFFVRFREVKGFGAVLSRPGIDVDVGALGDLEFLAIGSEYGHLGSYVFIDSCPKAHVPPQQNYAFSDTATSPLAVFHLYFYQMPSAGDSTTLKGQLVESASRRRMSIHLMCVHKKLAELVPPHILMSLLLPIRDDLDGMIVTLDTLGLYSFTVTEHSVVFVNGLNNLHVELPCIVPNERMLGMIQTVLDPVQTVAVRRCFKSLLAVEATSPADGQGWTGSTTLLNDPTATLLPATTSSSTTLTSSITTDDFVLCFDLTNVYGCILDTRDEASCNILNEITSQSKSSRYIPFGIEQFKPTVEQERARKHPDETFRLARNGTCCFGFVDLDQRSLSIDSDGFAVTTVFNSQSHTEDNYLLKFQLPNSTHFQPVVLQTTRVLQRANIALERYSDTEKAHSPPSFKSDEIAEEVISSLMDLKATLDRTSPDLFRIFLDREMDRPQTPVSVAVLNYVFGVLSEDRNPIAKALHNLTEYGFPFWLFLAAIKSLRNEPISVSGDVIYVMAQKLSQYKLSAPGTIFNVMTDNGLVTSFIYDGELHFLFEFDCPRPLLPNYLTVTTPKYNSNQLCIFVNPFEEASEEDSAYLSVTTSLNLPGKYMNPHFDLNDIYNNTANRTSHWESYSFVGQNGAYNPEVMNLYLALASYAFDTTQDGTPTDFADKNIIWGAAQKQYSISSVRTTFEEAQYVHLTNSQYRQNTVTFVGVHKSVDVEDCLSSIREDAPMQQGTGSGRENIINTIYGSYVEQSYEGLYLARKEPLKDIHSRFSDIFLTYRFCFSDVIAHLEPLATELFGDLKTNELVWVLAFVYLGHCIDYSQIFNPKAYTTHPYVFPETTQLRQLFQGCPEAERHCTLDEYRSFHNFSKIFYSYANRFFEMRYLASFKEHATHIMSVIKSPGLITVPTCDPPPSLDVLFDRFAIQDPSRQMMDLSLDACIRIAKISRRELPPRGFRAIVPDPKPSVFEKDGCIIDSSHCLIDASKVDMCVVLSEMFPTKPIRSHCLKVVILFSGYQGRLMLDRFSSTFSYSRFLEKSSDRKRYLDLDGTKRITLTLDYRQMFLFVTLRHCGERVSTDLRIRWRLNWPVRFVLILNKAKAEIVLRE
ncbi:hypothetical protein GMRT_14227 [Giardia muris]|uniref:Uncharacterized protein n=1 Tax=Giardia muris TaxID=5742 RepID=A0A4Z1SWV9_GIAMU|nr:hypothetical protein GMRT_14227 [Giardia muris]|eukprot:TNJ30234.1 hypothetical protein GMRT_14227 [Giardia muris]